MAGRLGVDVVNISFGGYFDRSNPEDDLFYQGFLAAVRYARSRGTVVVAAAGNDHVRLGAGGRVLSHGSLGQSGQPDRFGQYWAPGGIPGVVNVSATNNVVNAPSAACPPGTTGDEANGNATCKPRSDQHQPFGVGHRDQLAYYSNYGPRIDIAAPGGARKFNLPIWDRGGTPGFPYTSADATNVWAAFSTSSNWSVFAPDQDQVLRCFRFTRGSGFPQGQCYSTTQGTSMAAPHVAAAVALVAGVHPSLRHRPARLVARLKATARTVHNRTPALSATDTSPGDLSGVPCPAGYCHLGGPAVPDREAYGAGLVSVASP